MAHDHDGAAASRTPQGIPQPAHLPIRKEVPGPGVDPPADVSAETESKLKRGRDGSKASSAPGYRPPSRQQTTALSVHLPKDVVETFRRVAHARATTPHRMMQEYVLKVVREDGNPEALEAEKQRRQLEYERSKRAGVKPPG